MYCKFIVWIGRQAPSLGQIVLLVLATTHIYKNRDYEPCYPFHGATVSTGSAARASPAAIRIYSLRNLDSEPRLINAGLI